jgi:multidrug efflux pump subunit AcrA (membrane-fusion protein)
MTWPAAAIGVVGVAVALFEPLKALSEPVPTAEQPKKNLTVNVSRPEPAATTNVVLPATIRPWQVTTLNSRVTGYLTAWHADLGARVKAGDVLAELETPELDQEVAEAQAQAAEAVAAVVQAQAEQTEADAAVNSSAAELVKAKAEVELAKSLLGRREKLLASRSISQDEHETFQKQWEARQADVTAAESEVSRRRKNLETRAAVIEARQATAKSRQANVERLKELQGFKRIVAPFEGIVTERSAEVGMLVSAGKEPLFVLQDMSRVRVQVNVPQANSAQTHVGSEATVSLPESTAAAIRSTVTRVSQSVDSTSRTMLAEIELDNAQHGLQPGSYVQVSLATPQAGTAWTVAVNTVQMRVDGPHVAVVTRDDSVELKPVTLGRNLGNRVVVTEGIHGDERLIVNPSDTLTSGARVEVSSQAVAKR